MRPEFYDAYRDLADIYRISERYPFPFPVRRLRPDVRLVTEAIDAVLREMGLEQRLRPDARLFLVVNVHQMVVLPLSYTAHMPPRDLLKDMIRDDIRSVLQVAISSERRDQREVSGHAVVNALSQVWEKLRITEFQLWG